ncbi:MAG TPA: DUF4147 domain-containing protein [Novosphingobium sp.]|nr:DUF4147 domain-containing protein [Novosphingobium sp.]
MTPSDDPPVTPDKAPEPAGSADRRARRLLMEMFEAAVASANPAKMLASHLPPLPKGRCIVVGAGKAAASMAAAVEAAWPHVDLTGAVAVPYGYGMACRCIRVIEAGHPVPDSNSVAAAQAILNCVEGLRADDLVLALVSGGGSAAMCLPAAGLTLEDKQITNRLLLASGFDIRTMNAVRRRISAIKGGRLAAAAAPARVVTLAISDIPGDGPSAIASGPTALPRQVEPDLREVARKLGPGLPPRVAELLARPPEPVREGRASPITVVAAPAGALKAAADVAKAHGVTPLVLGDDIEGESSLFAREMAASLSGPLKPTVWISGGETTVTIGNGGGGRGGRNTEFVLALARELNGRADIWALAADTDGQDGANLGAAGAFAGPDTIRRAEAMGMDPAEYLAKHDSGSFFQALGDLVTTGPTRTNVNDFRAILSCPGDYRAVD